LIDKGTDDVGAGGWQTALFHALNEGIALVASEFEQSDDPTAVWSFHCECGAEDCNQWVELGLDGYGAIRRGPEPGVLAPGHPVERARRVRVESVSLREDSRALRAQARHQIRRAHAASSDGELVSYRYIVRSDERIIATGRVSLRAPVEVGDQIELSGLNGTVRTVEPVPGEPELRLIVEERRNPR